MPVVVRTSVNSSFGSTPSASKDRALKQSPSHNTRTARNSSAHRNTTQEGTLSGTSLEGGKENVVPLNKSAVPLSYTLLKSWFDLPALQGRADRAMTIVTFDVDGTLITSTGSDTNKLHKLAFVHAFKTVFDLDTNIDVIQHHGLTDPLILILVLEHHGIPQDKSMSKLKELEEAMVEFFESHRGSAGAGLKLLPGVHQVLSALKARGDVVTGLVTGNLEPIGWGKMEALGIQGLFSRPKIGGFGSDFCSGNTSESWRDRAELVRIAHKRAAEAESLPDSGGPKFHVGDTPMDLKAAAEGGAQAIGVLTGIYTREQLEATGVDAVILDSMENLAQVLAAFNLPPAQA